jgi:hypothetical protein
MAFYLHYNRFVSFVYSSYLNRILNLLDLLQFWEVYFTDMLPLDCPAVGFDLLLDLFVIFVIIINLHHSSFKVHDIILFYVFNEI